MIFAISQTCPTCPG